MTNFSAFIELGSCDESLRSFNASGFCSLVVLRTERWDPYHNGNFDDFNYICPVLNVSMANEEKVIEHGYVQIRRQHPS